MDQMCGAGALNHHECCCILSLPDSVVKYRKQWVRQGAMRRGRKLRIEWAAEDDAASLRAQADDLRVTAQLIDGKPTPLFPRIQ